MSNEKLSIQDLVDAIAQRTGYSKKRSDDFLRVLQTTIEEGLINDGLVKIKGFGTFKLVWNEARKSVNVQTGKEYIIPGHNKVSFLPEAIVKDTINGTSISVSSGVKPPINPLEKLNEQAEEIKVIISELKDLVPDAEGAGGSIDLIEAPAMPIEKGADLVAEEAKKVETVTETKPIAKKEDNKAASTPVATDANAPTASEPHKMHERDIPVKKKKKGWILAIVIVFVLLIGGGGVYVEFENIQFFFTHLMDDYDTPKPTKTAQPVVTKKPVLVTARKQLPAKDTIKAVQPKQQPAEKKAVQVATVAAKPQPKVDNVNKSNAKKVATKPKAEPKATQKVAPTKTEPKAQKSNKTSIFDKPRVYKTFICTETIEKGSHLTLIAQKYYGYKTFWVYIYEANKDKISNPESLPVGFKVKVPKLDAELIDLKNPMCTKYAHELEAKYVHK